MKFEECITPEDVKQHLLKVLDWKRTDKNNEFLYHYTSIQAIDSILSSGYIWLGSSENMNDYLEDDFIRSANADHTLFFTSFSKAEENLAMYKMYAPAPNGAMLSFSYMTANEIVKSIGKSENGMKEARIVRNGILTEECIDVNVYWCGVCYKELHNDTLIAGTKINKHFSEPLSISELAGIIKLNGWSYENEVRLCAETSAPLSSNEKIAIKLPDNFSKLIKIITCPNFDRKINSGFIKKLKRKSIKIQSSEYEDMVDLGFSNVNILTELENENRRLKAKIQEYEADERFEESEYDDIFIDGYHEVKNRQGDILKKGYFIDGRLVNGEEYNHIIMVAEGTDIHTYSDEVIHPEKPVTLKDIPKENWHYEPRGQYDDSFRLMYFHDDIIEKGLDFFYVVDKRVELRGRQIKPTFFNFRTLECFLAEKEPEELEYIKTGVYKYEEADCAEIMV